MQFLQRSRQFYYPARQEPSVSRLPPCNQRRGERLRSEFAIGDEIDSIILIEDGHAYLHSTAGLRVAKGLGGPWAMAYALIIVPSFIRDFIYKTFAKYRYRLFGKKDVCMMPTPDIRERFIG
jgi:predicted DCC family thiol-disulfide oxidoreductase YuxK